MERGPRGVYAWTLRTSVLGSWRTAPPIYDPTSGRAHSVMARSGQIPSTGRLMIAVLGGLADVERDLIRTRAAEGRSRARASGQHMGRPPKLAPQQQREARRRAEGATLKELAKSYNVGLATIARLAA